MYRVTWTIDFDDDEVSSAHEAAQKALEIQRNPESIATFFEVTHDGVTVDVDLETEPA